MVARSDDPNKCRQPIAGRRQKFNLIRALRPALAHPGPAFPAPESVDGAKDPLYKGANWRWAQSCRRCSLSSCRLLLSLRDGRKAHRSCSGNGPATEHPKSERRFRGQAAGATRPRRDRYPQRTLRPWPTPPPPRKRRARSPAAPPSTSRAAPRCAAPSAPSKKPSRPATAPPPSKALASAEPALMRAAQRNIVHKNNASRKVSRLTAQIAKLAK